MLCNTKIKYLDCWNATRYILFFLVLLQLFLKLKQNVSIIQKLGNSESEYYFIIFYMGLFVYKFLL